MRRKNLTEADDIPPPNYKILFVTRHFLKHRRVHLWSFSVLWEKVFAEAVIQPPLIQREVLIPANFWKVETFPYVNFRHNDSLNFWRKVIISPLLTRIVFWYPIFPETQKGSPMKFSSTVKRNFFGEAVLLSSLLCIKFSNTRVLLKHRSVRLWSF